jgi:flagellar M-ring protein FliF
MEFLKRIREQVVNLWNRMNKGQKIGLVSSLGILMIAMATMLFVTSQPEKHTLYKELTAEDAELVLKDLREKAVKYEVKGGEVLVYARSEEVDELRMDLASQGVPKSGGIGWEYLEKQGFGETEKTFDQKKHRAKEVELVRTIKTIEVIKDAKVTLATPAETVFIDEETPPTASVVLELKPNESINARQVSAITHLVSKAVEKLKPENITVVDTSGNLLSSGDDMLPGGISTKQWEVQRNYQAMLQRNIQSLLDRSLGPDKAIARVGVELDFSKKDEATEAYTEGADVSSQEKKESYEGGEVKPGGPNGTTSNIPSYPGIQNQGPSDYRQEEKIVNKAPTKKVTNKSKAPAEVKKVTVGVLVDQALLSPSAGAMRIDLRKIEELKPVVAMAAGFAMNDRNSDGDLKGSIEIEPIPFNIAKTPETKEEPWWLKYLPLLLLVAIAFITFLMLGAMLQPKRQIPARAPRKAVITPAAALPTSATAGAAMAAIPTTGGVGALAGGGMVGGIPMAPTAETPRGFWESLEEQREEAERRLMADIETALQDSPKVSADLLRGWMKSDRAGDAKERGRV